jgi:hypothetical protein
MNISLVERRNHDIVHKAITAFIIPWFGVLLQINIHWQMYAKAKP